MISEKANGQRTEDRITESRQMGSEGISTGSCGPDLVGDRFFPRWLKQTDLLSNSIIGYSVIDLTHFYSCEETVFLRENSPSLQYLCIADVLIS